jgi:hypothetical protein
MRKWLIQPKIILWLLALQFIPLLLLPSTSYALNTQEWWLPAMLVILVFVAAIQLMVRHSTEQWPWYLFSFSQGFNIISRLMMLMPHTTLGEGANQTLNTPHLVLGILSMLISAFYLWYMEMPEVRLSLLQKPHPAR